MKLSQSVVMDFDSQFKVLAILGSGSFGTVFKAECQKTRDVVALKRIQQAHGEFEAYTVEIKLLSNLHHENILTFRSCFSDIKGKYHY
eukprot:Awhi_evm1s10424